jgi:hypothetical protein
VLGSALYQLIICHQYYHHERDVIGLMLWNPVMSEYRVSEGVPGPCQCPPNHHTQPQQHRHNKRFKPHIKDSVGLLLIATNRAGLAVCVCAVGRSLPVLANQHPRDIMGMCYSCPHEETVGIIEVRTDPTSEWPTGGLLADSAGCAAWRPSRLLLCVNM